MDNKQVSLCFIQNDKKEILLLKRGQNESFPGIWCFPGGKVDPGETFDEACFREVYEETGLIVNLWERYDSNEFEGLSLRIFDSIECVGNMREFPTEEHESFSWVEPNEIANYNVSPFVTKYLKWRLNIDV